MHQSVPAVSRLPALEFPDTEIHFLRELLNIKPGGVHLSGFSFLEFPRDDANCCETRSNQHPRLLYSITQYGKNTHTLDLNWKLNWNETIENEEVMHKGL